MLNCVLKNIPSNDHLNIEVKNMIFIPKEVNVKNLFYISATNFANISINTINVNDFFLSVQLNKKVRKIILFNEYYISIISKYLHRASFKYR